jgi:hypothetical protein
VAAQACPPPISPFKPLDTGSIRDLDTILKIPPEEYNYNGMVQYLSLLRDSLIDDYFKLYSGKLAVHFSHITLCCHHVDYCFGVFLVQLAIQFLCIISLTLAWPL